MIRMNDWQSPEWVTFHWDTVPPEPGKPPPTATTGQRPDPVNAMVKALVNAICDRLALLKPEVPSAVHFYLGEGLRWIRIGFAADGKALKPAAVRQIGAAIVPCLTAGETLYFHALRPHDILFFLEGGKPSKIGLPPKYFGLPLRELERQWNLRPAHR